MDTEEAVGMVLGPEVDRTVATTTMAMVNMEADKPAEIVAEVDGETEVATVEVVIVEAIVAVAMAIVVVDMAIVVAVGMVVAAEVAVAGGRLCCRRI